ncbi:MAG: hypothetical protein V1911_01410 [Candidatus Micrarchaeota archaeon]
MFGKEGGGFFSKRKKAEKKAKAKGKVVAKSDLRLSPVQRCKRMDYLKRGVPIDIVSKWEERAANGESVIITQNTTGTGPRWAVEKRTQSTFATWGGQFPEIRHLDLGDRAGRLLMVAQAERLDKSRILKSLRDYGLSIKDANALSREQLLNKLQDMSSLKEESKGSE